MSDYPRPPEDVRLYLRDGREVEAECAYAGAEQRDGVPTHVWIIVSPRVSIRQVKRMSVGVLPGHTSIQIPV